jgi:hypothetical protein
MAVDSTAAAAVAAERVAAARDTPEARLELAAAFYDSRSGGDAAAGFGRSELAFLRFQIDRGVMNPTTGPSPGSAWWRAVSERLLRDTSESGLLADGHTGEPSSRSVEIWLEFLDRPSSASWYRAHNASVVAGYLEHQALATQELLAERFFMNVALLRVLYTHALAARPRLALGRLAPLGRLLGDPRGGMVDTFLSVDRVFPTTYPLEGLDLGRMIGDENELFRAVDYGIIGPRVDDLYEFAAESLGEPRVRTLVRDGTPSYAWPDDQRHHWLDGGTRLLPRLVARAVGH